MPDAPRLIAHLDMDAFYASVALLRYPELRGRPMVIGGGSRHQPVETPDPATGGVVREFATLRDYTGRGVVMTATYEARALGLHSALGLMKAAAIAPDVVLLPTDFDSYRKYSRLFKAAVRTLATQVEDRGIDEIYIDLTDVETTFHGLAAREPSPDPWRRARAVAQSIKEAVRAATGLSCSIGVAPNKLLAKISSDLDKPDGLTLLTPADIPARIWPLPARKINGIGPKSSAKLEALGIRTIGELARADPQWLIEKFGANYGAWLHDVAHGRDERPVVTHSETKSISRETTFERDLSATRDRDLLSRVFTELCAGVTPEKSDAEITHWTAQELTEEVVQHSIVASISPSQVSRYLREAALQPHKSRSWPNTTEKDPPALEEQVKTICDTYLAAPRRKQPHQTHTVSVDEMTGLQALERIAPSKAMIAGIVPTDRVRVHATRTLCLIGNLVVTTGELLRPTIGATRTETDFASHIEQTVATDPEGSWVFVVDNLNIHCSESLVKLVAEACEVPTDLGTKGKRGVLKSVASRQAFLSESSHRIRFVYLPKHSSWLNQIEVVFGVIMRKVIRRGSFTSVEDLPRNCGTSSRISIECSPSRSAGRTRVVR